MDAEAYRLGLAPSGELWLDLARSSPPPGREFGTTAHRPHALKDLVDDVRVAVERDVALIAVPGLPDQRVERLRKQLDSEDPVE